MKTCLDTNTVISDLIPGSKVNLNQNVTNIRIYLYNLWYKYFIFVLFLNKNIWIYGTNCFSLQYKFRVMSASIAGISEASPESEEGRGYVALVCSARSRTSV